MPIPAASPETPAHYSPAQKKQQKTVKSEQRNIHTMSLYTRDLP